MSTPKRLRAPRSALTPGPDHAAAPQRFWESAPFRTTVQGISIDVALAVALVIYGATSGDAVDWKLLGALLIKTLLMTVASSFMKRVKPRQLTDRAAS